MSDKYDDAFYEALDSVGYAKDGEGTWWCAVPGMTDGQIPLQGQTGGPIWAITEHDDSTITAHPSVDCQSDPVWHGWLRHGVWELA